MAVINLIKDYWVLITFLTGCLSAFSLYIKHMVEATKCSLRNDILSIYDRAEARGNKITRYELDALTHSASIYFKLKGNSFVEALIERVKHFELVD